VRAASSDSQWMPIHDADRLSKDESDRTIRAAVERDPDLWVLLIDAESFAAGSGAAHPCRPIDGANVSIPDAMALRAAAILRQRHQ